MPALTPRSPGLAPPPQFRRRIWQHPELRSHSLLVLTPDRLQVAPLVGEPKSETLSAAESGTDLDNLFGPLAIVVDLATVRRVKLDLLANSVLVEYGLGGARRMLTVVFATPEVADACFTKIWRRLGDGFGLLPYRRNTWALARTPLLVLGTVMVFTMILGLGLAVIEDVAASRAAAVSVPAAGDLGTPVGTPAGLPWWLSWKLVCGLGGAAAAAVQVWLYRRLTQPPVSLEVIGNPDG